MRNTHQKINVIVAVVAIRFLIAPGVVEVDPVNPMTGLMLLLVNGIDELTRNGQDRLLVLLGVDGQGDEPHEDGAVFDNALQAEDIVPALLTILNHGVGDGLELDEGAKVGVGGSGLHLEDVFVM